MVTPPNRTTATLSARLLQPHTRATARSNGIKTSFAQLLRTTGSVARPNLTPRTASAPSSAAFDASQKLVARHVSVAPAIMIAAPPATVTPAAGAILGIGAGTNPQLMATPPVLMPMTSGLDLRPPDLGVSSAPHGLDAATGLPRETSADRYWDSQPPAVQALRDIKDPNVRAQTASNLASQGYTIDVPIMVWNWDPEATMAGRQNMGYTWVPSSGQPNVGSAPGLGGYDPTHMPPGAIAVNLDFAKGAAGHNSSLRRSSSPSHSDPNDPPLLRSNG